jgi:hypothetical protein
VLHQAVQEVGIHALDAAGEPLVHAPGDAGWVGDDGVAVRGA